jgi:hypothetical protein
MINFIRIINSIFIVIAMFVYADTNAQCGVVSSNGYNVAIEIRPVSIIKPATCPAGYNYNVSFLYNVGFSGTNIPANLYTLEGNLYCNGQANFFQIPLAGGSGTGTTTSNSWRAATDCATATTSSLQCNIVNITIEGPGILNQTFKCNAAGTLPIDLVSFNGRIVGNNNVYLNWVTATETNNKTFTVERSTNAAYWLPVKILNAATNSTTTKEYAYTDAGLAPGMYYYRLKQTDISGANTYSNIIGANITKGNSGTDINLTYRSNQLYFAGLANSSEWEVAVYNSASSAVMVNSTINSSVVQLPDLTSGIYFVRVRNKLSNTEKTLKFFKG